MVGKLRLLGRHLCRPFQAGNSVTHGDCLAAGRAISGKFLRRKRTERSQRVILGEGSVDSHALHHAKRTPAVFDVEHVFQRYVTQFPFFAPGINPGHPLYEFFAVWCAWLRSELQSADGDRAGRPNELDIKPTGCGTNRVAGSRQINAGSPLLPQPAAVGAPGCGCKCSASIKVRTRRQSG